MVSNLLIVIPLILAQNEAQKNETYLAICILALFGIVFIMDMFAKGKIISEKPIKKMYLFFACLFIFLFVILFFVLKEKN